MTGPRWPAFLPLVLFPPLLTVAEPVAPATGDKPEEKSPPATRVEVFQGTLPSPIKDERCAVYRNAIHGGDKTLKGALPGAIAVHFPDKELSFCWDPVECRLLYVWKGGFLQHQPDLAGIAGKLVYVAEGPAPLAASVGAFDAPDFFGYRLVNGVPEFLYTQGLLSVAERFELAADGQSFTQFFSVQNTPFEVNLAIPERWKESVSSSIGTWTKGFVTIPLKSIKDFRLTFQLLKTPELPEVRKNWNPFRPPPVPKLNPPPAESEGTKVAETPDPEPLQSSEKGDKEE